MPPKYPFSRAQPSSSSTADRPIVVSASGRAPSSPAAGFTLSAESPSTLRSRIPSPRNPASGAGDVFSNEASSYPSPSGILRGKVKVRTDKDVRKEKEREKEKSGLSKSKGGWLAQPDDSPGPSRGAPPNNFRIPRFDTRGYPAREHLSNGHGNGAPSPESNKSLPFDRSRLPPSDSHDSLSSVSTTGAGVNEEAGPFLSEYSERPSSHFGPLSSEGHTPADLYPPVINYSLSAPSCNLYDNPVDGQIRRSPEPSLYGYDYDGGSGNGHGGYGYGVFGESRVSLNRMNSEASMTHFKKYDSLNDSYGAFSVSSKGGKKHIADMFSLPADPSTWSYLGPEADDDFHDPDVRPNRQTRFISTAMTVRGVSNLGCLIFLFLLMMSLFTVYPITSIYLSKTASTNGAYNLGGVNASGQLPDIGPFQLIDKDTPSSAYTYTSMETGETWELIFSDEFNNDGRTFYGGDDPYWEAVDLHYWQTNNLEWYDPRQITTKNGSLIITLTDTPTNGMNYTGGMISSWNQFCFTGGYIEASVSLPGTSKVYGLWPAIWTMGNLGRAGYGGSLDGMWPYSYDSCDVGTLANQTLNDLPTVALTEGDPDYGGSLSYLPGQRLSRCTCPSDTTHPGPVFANGTFKGRAAPEIDLFEALVTTDTLIGEVSQSGQWAPFNPNYDVVNTSSTWEVVNDSITAINGYKGGVYQQATSAVSKTDQDCYTQGGGCFSIYGFEYASGYDGYITWVNAGKKSWTVRGAAMASNADAEIGARPVSEEPMYIIVNLGLSENFGAIDYEGLEKLYPVTMEVDYIRVYQDPNNRNIGCDPPDMPTASYIAQFPDSYYNPNITVMDEIPNFTMPKNSMIDTC